MTDHDKRVEELVNLLGCSIFEAEQIIADDKKIDKGQEVDFGLTKEQEKQALKYANVKEHKKPAVYKFDKRERKADTTKEGVIEQISQFLIENGYENVEITNKSKLIAFKIGEDNYEFNLIRKRKPKN
jgi:phosphoribosylformylglycinamidine (FGAM) synthase PurS component